MSHEVESMAFANAVPWHGLGNRVDPRCSVDEMLVQSGLDWSVQRLPLYARAQDGSPIRIPGRKALVRSSDNKIMTLVSDGWKPLQNKDVLELFRDYVDAGGATLETAGALRAGKVVWALANLRDGFSVNKSDHVKGYLLMTSRHEVGTTISVRTTTIRVVCANTMAMAMSDAQAQVHYKQNHLREFDVSAAKRAIEAAHEQLARAAKQAAQLNKLKLDMKGRVEFLAKFFQPDSLKDGTDLTNSNTWGKQLSEVMNSVENGPGATPNTGWGVLNGVLHWADHAAGRGSASRMFRSWVGDYSRLKLQVNDDLLELAQ